MPWKHRKYASGGRLYGAIRPDFCVVPKASRQESKTRDPVISEDRERGSKADRQSARIALDGSKTKLFLLRDAVQVPHPTSQAPFPPATYPPFAIPREGSIELLVTQTGGHVGTTDQSSFEELLQATFERD